MSGENTFAKQAVAEALQEAEANSQFDQDAMGRALINAVIEHYKSYRNVADITQELNYIIDNLDEDEFVITRGC